MKQEMKQELKQEIKQEMKQELKQEIKQELKQEMKQEMKHSCILYISSRCTVDYLYIAFFGSYDHNFAPYLQLGQSV